MSLGLSKKYHPGQSSVSSDGKNEDAFVFPGICIGPVRFFCVIGKISSERNPFFAKLNSELVQRQTPISSYVDVTIQPVPCLRIFNHQGALRRTKEEEVLTFVLSD
jgi:hypothetical protein